MARHGRYLLPVLIALAAPTVAWAQSVEAVRADDRTVGSVTAPVTLTVYLSTTCGHCAAWHTEDLPALKARYVDTGQVRIAYRDLPTPPQQVAIVGTVMARCAPAEKYDAVLDALFLGQARLQAAPAEAQREAVTGWLFAGGVAGGLTPDQMNACFADQANFAEVQDRAEQAFADGVSSTPSFFINGERVPDAALLQSRGVAAFEPLIQPLLDAR